MDTEHILGAVLAGGKSTRFGSDKALAVLNGETLLARAVARLEPWCRMVIAVGREHAPVPVVADWPGPGLGPLGGIAAALRFGREQGFAGVLTIGVDSLGLPDDLLQRLVPEPAYLADQPVVGLWPVSAFDTVSQILAGDGRHSMRALAEAVGARAVRLDVPSINVNFPEDLTGLGG